MNDLRVAAQQALEFLDAEFGWSPGEAPRIDALRAALAQQEPVATVTECEACFTPDVCRLRGACDHYSAQKLRVAHPPRREWQSLTEEEKADILFPLTAAGASDMECARAIEAALKERNT
jgi:hypothetical protein